MFVGEREEAESSAEVVGKFAIGLPRNMCVCAGACALKRSLNKRELGHN